MSDETKKPFNGYFHGKVYELTIAPSDAKQFVYPQRGGHIQGALQRIDQFYAYYDNLFRSYARYIEVALNLEITEVNVGENMPRLHLHGTLKIKERSGIVTFLLHILPTIQKYARVSINNHRPKIWSEYIAKQQYIYEHTIYAKYKTITNKTTNPTTFLEYIPKDDQD